MRQTGSFLLLFTLMTFVFGMISSVLILYLAFGFPSSQNRFGYTLFSVGTVLLGLFVIKGFFIILKELKK